MDDVTMVEWAKQRAKSQGKRKPLRLRDLRPSQRRALKEQAEKADITS